MNQLMYYTFVIIGIILIVLLRLFIHQDPIKRTKIDFGNLQKYKKENIKGIIFGKYGRRYICSDEQSEGSIAVLGPSGTGKTSSILIPTLRNWQYPNTFFCIDISGDIFKNTRSYVKNKLVFAPNSSKSMPYNIFGVVDAKKERQDKIEALEQLSLALVPQDPNAKDAARYFNKGGLSIIKAALIAGYFENMDFCDICNKIASSSYKSLFKWIDKTQNNDAMAYINGFEGQNENNITGCFDVAVSSIELFGRNPKLQKNIRRPDKGEKAVTPRMLEKYNVYCIIPDELLEYLSPVLAIVTAQTLEYLTKRSNNSKTTILLALDEFASFGRLNITAGLRKLRKKHVRIMLLTQSIADLYINYSHDEAAAMLTNCTYQVILGAQDPDSQKYYAELIGKAEKYQYSFTSGSSNDSETKSINKEYIFEPSELAHLKDKLILLHPNGMLKLNKNYYFK